MNRPKRALGQNFLVNTKIIEAIYSKFIILFPNVDFIIEIGPGRGALTKPLLNLNVPIIAVEKDKFLVKELETDLKNDNLAIICGDGARIDLSRIEGISSYKNQILTGNLPYNMASQIIQNAIHHIPLLSGLLIMIQREMAERIYAKPATKDYGAYSVFCQSFCEIKPLFHISPSAFRPKPKVTSSLIAMIPKNKPLVEKRDIDKWWLFLRRAFTNRRKISKKVLMAWYKAENIKKAWGESGLSDNARSEEMNTETLRNLFLLLKESEI